MSRFNKPLPTIIPGPQSPVLPVDDFQKTIEKAWSQNATFQKDDLSKSQQKVDKIIDKVSNAVSKTQSAYESVNAFYSANQSVFAAAASSLANLNGDSTAIEATMSAFTQYCPIVLKGLDSLGQLHPFIGVATKAFSLVITMDLTRRQNNKKVIALKMQMQDTMMILFDLRHMKDPDHTDAQGNTMENRMSALLKKIAQDITEAGSACDHYIKKSFVAKTLKSMKYEARLASFGDEFVNHRKNLKLALSIHTALGVDTANTKLDTLASQTESLQTTMAEILRKLDTPREKATKEFIKEQGGAKACLQDEQLVKKLIDLSGESVSDITSRKTGDEGKDFEAARKQLIRDYAEDLDKAFERNLTMFERKMEMQNKQMEAFFEDSLHNEGQLIIAALKAGSYDRIVDDDMQALWKENEWKGSVKARHFVLALQDFYADKVSSEAKGSEPPPTVSFVSGIDALPKDDRWALKYLDVSRVQPILEAIDDDGTGFISIKEVNDFATSKPEGWSLPMWIAYWAAGWHADIVRYKRKVYAVIREFYQVLHYDPGAPLPKEKRNLPMNRYNMDLYLCDEVFSRIDLLLRSLQPLASDSVNDVKLQQIIDEYSASEEKRLKENLESVAYDIDTPATVALVTGPGRIERFALPLIYLLLKRHLQVFYVAQTHVLHEQEFTDLSASLHNVFVPLDERIEGLTAIFKQTAPDVSKRLSNFAFGLLQLSYVDRRPNASKSSLRPWNEEGKGAVVVSEAESPEAIAQIPMKILKYGLQDTLETQIYEHSIATFNPHDKTPRQGISGYWAGHLWSRENSKDLYAYEGLIQISITEVGEDGVVKGAAEGFHGLMTVSGKITEDNEVSLTFEFEDGDQFFCEGKYDPDSDVLAGDFTFQEYEDDDEKSDDGPPDVQDDDDDDGDTEASEVDSVQEKNTFFFNRTPAFAWRFHPLYGQASRNARERWAFAINAVLDGVKRKHWSWNYLRARNAERRRFLELKLREEMEWSYTPSQPLNDDEKKELQLLIAKLHPTDARFYFSLVGPMIETSHVTHLDYECDVCEATILDSRHICLICVADDFNDNFDICSSAACVNASGARDSFSHIPSHASLKVNRMIVDGELAWAIPKARKIAARIKDLFRTKHSLVNGVAPEGTKGQDKDKSKDKSKRAEALCCCCAKEVDTPCWVCLYCPRNTYLCDDCEAARTPVLQDANSPNKWHDHKHFLIRIYDDVGAAELPTVETRLLTLENKLAGVETRLQSFENRFSNVEDMLQRVLAALVPASPDELPND